MKKDDLYGETKITKEHIRNNGEIRKLLGARGIKPETLPSEEDIKKVEKSVKVDEKKIETNSQRLKKK